MNTEQLVEAAREAAQHSYSPYSNFRVGATVVGANGEIVSGANIENAAYPATSCAEATAIATAVSQGIREIDTVAVACIDADDVDGAYPCGRCRQIMTEFGVKKVIVAGGPGSEIREHTLEELLPYGFSL